MKRKNIYELIGLILAILIMMTVGVIVARTIIGNSNYSTTISEDYIPSETSTTKEVATTKKNTTREVSSTEQTTTSTTTTTIVATTKSTTTTKVATTKTTKTTTTKHTTAYIPLGKAWEEKYEEYPIASEVWMFMKNEIGWSDAVCAGVMGNMMAECGGHTLNLKWNIYNSSGYYGLCQWSRVYYPQMQGASLQQQLEFLKKSVKEVYEFYGSSYDDFISLTDYTAAARSFNDIYERPGYYSSKRSSNAKTAYNYFAN